MTFTPLVPESAWLLTQASLAASHPVLRNSASKLHTRNYDNTNKEPDNNLIVGPGLDGALTNKTGFLSGFDQEYSLPVVFEPWEATVAQLPSLLRQGRIHKVVVELPPLLDEVKKLEDRYLARVALVTSTLLQSYAYETRNLGWEELAMQLPENIAESWDYVNSKLGRPHRARMVADDILNNYRRYNGGPARAAIEYFDVQEEGMSAGLQIQMEDTFAPTLEMMTNAQKAVLAGDDEGLVTELGRISGSIISCSETFLAVPFKNGTDGFDPVYWGKTYPEIGRPLRKGTLPNSGVNSPLFHALDAFLNTIDPKDDLHGQQVMRRSIMPYTVRRFIEALESPLYSVRSYAEKSSSSAVKASLNALVQVYAWFLERHRLRAISAISIALASGRPRTAGGAQQAPSTMPVDEMLNRQMQSAVGRRFRGLSQTLTSEVLTALPVGTKAVSITILLPCPLPVEVGDRIQVWPRNNFSPEELAKLRQILGSEVDLDLLETLDARTLLSKESLGLPSQETIKKLPTITPRHYTIAQVDKNIHGLSRHVVLTVAQSEGPSARFLHKCRPGQLLSTRVVPELRFRPPSGNTPLLLIAQGAGVGPFVGYLRRRLEQSTREEIGTINLIVCAKQTEDVSYLSELTSLTERLPLTVHLALSCSESLIIAEGIGKSLNGPRKVQAVLFNLESDIKAMCISGEGHVYVCGSVGFGQSVRSTLDKIGVIDGGRYHEDCFGGRTSPITRSSVSLEELSLHNTSDSLWMAIDGTVYDLTSFANNHPGGLKTLIESAGTVADRRFHLIHSGDYSQGILAQIAQYAIGPLDDKSLLPSQARTLSQIVLSQNVLRNNSGCAQGRHIPFYIYADSLHVSRRDLMNMVNDSEGDTIHIGEFAELEKYFNALKAISWQFLRNVLDAPVPERERHVYSVYSTLWDEFHALYDDLKTACWDNDQFPAVIRRTCQARTVHMMESARVGIAALSNSIPPNASSPC